MWEKCTISQNYQVFLLKGYRPLSFVLALPSFLLLNVCCPAVNMPSKM